jgi:Na+/proline symporter
LPLEEDAAKAIYFSSISQVITLMMLFVGAGLYAYYTRRAPSPAEAALFASDADYVFPVWITTVLPPGLTGLILAGAFAAAISSLDSVLAALSQTTMGLFSKRFGDSDGDHARLLWLSKVAVVAWGIGLSAFAVALDYMRGDINMVNLAFGMVSYTYGPMLGIFLLAILPINRDGRGVWLGVILSFLLVLYVRPDLYTILTNLDVITAAQAAAMKPNLHFAWLYPVTTCYPRLRRRLWPSPASAVVTLDRGLRKALCVGCARSAFRSGWFSCGSIVLAEQTASFFPRADRLEHT